MFKLAILGDALRGHRPFGSAVKRDIVYLRHIADAIRRIKSYIIVGRDVFLSTPHWQDAAIRQLEIIGEATKRLSTEIRLKRKVEAILSTL